MEVAHVGLRVDGSGAIRTLDGFTSSARRSQRAGNDLERTAYQLRAALYGLGLGLSFEQLAEYADTWKLVTAQIGLSTTSHEQQIAVQRELFNVSQRTRTDFAATASLYARLARNAEQLGITQQDVIFFTESLNNALLVSGATTAEATQGVRQLGQALGANRLQGDEFRTMMEAMPAVSKALAQSLGVSIDKLYEMSAAGELNAGKVVKAVLEMREQFAAQAEEIPITIGQAFIQLRNEMVLWIGVVDEGVGASDSFVGMLRLLRENLSAVAAGILAAMTAWVAYHAAMRSVAIMHAVVTSAQTIRAFIQLAVTIRRMADATALLQMVSKGVWGAVAAVAALGVGYAAYKKIIDEAFESTENWEKYLDTLNETIGNGEQAVAGLTKEQQRWVWQNEDMVREARQAAQAARLEGHELAVLEIQFEALNSTIEANRELTGQFLRDRLAAIEVVRRLRLEELANAEALEEHKKKLEELKEAHEKAVRAQEQILENFQENVQSSFADTFYQIVSGGIESFSDLFRSVKQMFFRMLAEMLAADAMRRWGTALAGALAGVFGGLAEASATVATTGAAAAAVEQTFRNAAGELVAVRIEGISNAASKSLLQVLASFAAVGGVGFGVGQIVGGLTTNRAAGAALGAGAGAAAGAAVGTFILPGIGTAAGAVVGGLAGVIGGFFGASKAAKKHREELEKIAEYRLVFQQNIRLREAALRGNEDEIEVLQLQINHERELAAIRKEGILTAREIRDFERLQQRERQELLRKQREELAKEQLDFRQDMEIRYLAASGNQKEADALRLKIEQQKEYNEAVKLGLTAEELARLKEIHALEAVADAANNLARSLANIPNGVPIDFWRAQGSRFADNGGSRPRPTLDDAPITLQFHIENLHTKATNGPQLLNEVVNAGIQDIQNGGQGLTQAIRRRPSV